MCRHVSLVPYVTKSVRYFPSPSFQAINSQHDRLHVVNKHLLSYHRSDRLGLIHVDGTILGLVMKTIYNLYTQLENT